MNYATSNHLPWRRRLLGSGSSKSSGCISQGKTREEAVTNIKEAIHAYIDALKEDGLFVPEERFENFSSSCMSKSRKLRPSGRDWSSQVVQAGSFNYSHSRAL